MVTALSKNSLNLGTLSWDEPKMVSLNTDETPSLSSSIDGRVSSQTEFPFPFEEASFITRE
jgi:hypothetical protein